VLFNLLTVFLTISACQVQEARVTKPAAKVDFTHHSECVELKNTKFSVTNFIRNNSTDSPLSIKWDDAGILCTGTLQLGPGQSDYGSTGGVMDTPSLKTKSEISYGLALQYSANSSIYVDPNVQEAKSNTYTSRYERRDKNGRLLFRIEVTSTREGIETATTTIKVTGGLSLVFQQQLIGKDAKISEGWSFTTARSFEALGLSEDVGSEASSWVSKQRVPFWDRTVVSDPFFYGVLRSETSSINEVTFRPSGTPVYLTKVFIAGFFPNKLGVVGMSAYVYLPKEEF